MAVTSTKAYTNVRPIPQPDNAAIKRVAVDIEFSSAAYAANDYIRVAKLPIGVKCVDWAIVFPDIDSNGAPALAWSLGTENAGLTDISSEVWGSALTAGQTVAPVRNTSSACAQGATDTERNLILKCTTAAATYAGAGKVGQLILDLVG